MKLIHKFKSPNFNQRKSNKINLIVIHYTALKSISESIKYLSSKKNKVSSHYVISRNGEIYNLVSEKNRAWHAGESYWQGNFDINSFSIGIELDYSPLEKNDIFGSSLTYSLIKLLKKLIKKHKITPENILGHSDVAPYRKIDPGQKFPWNLLEHYNISFCIKKLIGQRKIISIINLWYVRNKFFSEKKRILFMLDFIGYDISLALISTLQFNQLISVYCNRFKYYKNHNYNKKRIFNVIQLHFTNILLTKSQK